MAHLDSECDPPGFVRAFIAIDVGESVRETLREMVEPLRRKNFQVKWVDPENWHLTVKFLGSVQSSAIEDIAAALREESAKIAPFEFEVVGLQAFPPKRSPRIVAAGIRNAGAGLAELNRRLEERMQTFGVPAERREFRAHLTLGRVQGQRGMERLWRALEPFADTRFGNVGVRETILFESDLQPSGAKYARLAAARLLAPGS